MASGFFDGSGVQRVLGVAGAVRYPSVTNPYLGTGASNTNNSRIKGAVRILLHGYVVDVPAVARIVCVAGDGTTEIGGTGLTLVAGSLPGEYRFPGDGILWEPGLNTIATGQGANFGISCGAGITASATFSVL